MKINILSYPKSVHESHQLSLNLVISCHGKWHLISLAFIVQNWSCMFITQFHILTREICLSNACCWNDWNGPWNTGTMKSVLRDHCHETTCLYRPHMFGRRTYISIELNLPPDRPYFYGEWGGLSRQIRLYWCTYMAMMLWFSLVYDINWDLILQMYF